MESPFRKKVVCIADYGTDTTEDDATATCVIVNENNRRNTEDAILRLDIIVTGGPNTLDLRKSIIDKIKEKNTQQGTTITVQIAPLLGAGAGAGGRMLVPYGDMDSADAAAAAANAAAAADISVRSSYLKNEQEAIVDGYGVFSRIPKDTQVIICIGQVESNFFQNLTDASLVDLEYFSLQGPGFNTMPLVAMQPDGRNLKIVPGRGVEGDDTIKKFYLQMRKTKPGSVFIYSDNNSNLLINSADLHDRLLALSKLDGLQNILNVFNINVASFFLTAIKYDQFEGQFGNNRGFKYNNPDTLTFIKKISESRAASVEEVDGLAALEDLTITSGDVLKILKVLFPNGIQDMSQDAGQRISDLEELRNLVLRQIEVAREAATAEEKAKIGIRTYDEINAAVYSRKGVAPASIEELNLTVTEMTEVGDGFYVIKSSEKYNKEFHTYCSEHIAELSGQGKRSYDDGDVGDDDDDEAPQLKRTTTAGGKKKRRRTSKKKKRRRTSKKKKRRRTKKKKRRRTKKKKRRTSKKR